VARNKGGDRTERLNKKGQGVNPMCVPGFDWCSTDGSICVIDVPDCYNECKYVNVPCWLWD